MTLAAEYAMGCEQNFDKKGGLMTKRIKCPADILYEKEWRASYGNRCNAVFLSDVMGDNESMRKLFHNQGDTHTMTPLVKIFWDYYHDRDKEKMLDSVHKATTDDNGFTHPWQPFEVNERDGKRILEDWSSRGGRESPWANLDNYEKRATCKITDEFSSRQSVYYNNKSVAEVLKDTVEKSTFLEKRIEEPTGNKRLDLLMRNLQNRANKEFHLPTYAFALRLINNDLTLAYTGRKEPLDADAYVPVIITLDEMSAEVFNRIDYKQQRTFHKSDLGQEMLRFSYLTTQNLRPQNSSYNGFSETAMNTWLRDIKNTDLWQVAQHKITAAILERWSHRVKVGSLLNNRMMELATIKPQPKEAMYATYWREDNRRTLYMNLYKADTGKLNR